MEKNSRNQLVVWMILALLVSLLSVLTFLNDKRFNADKTMEERQKASDDSTITAKTDSMVMMLKKISYDMDSIHYEFKDQKAIERKEHEKLMDAFQRIERIGKQIYQNTKQ